VLCTTFLDHGTGRAPLRRKTLDTLVTAPHTARPLRDVYALFYGKK
jgi:hypothetical protein